MEGPLSLTWDGRVKTCGRCGTHSEVGIECIGDILGDVKMWDPVVISGFGPTAKGLVYLYP